MNLRDPIRPASLDKSISVGGQSVSLILVSLGVAILAALGFAIIGYVWPVIGFVLAVVACAICWAICRWPDPEPDSWTETILALVVALLAGGAIGGTVGLIAGIIRGIRSLF